jgi:hypothetical protein
MVMMIRLFGVLAPMESSPFSLCMLLLVTMGLSFSSNGKFSVQSLYAVISQHGVKPVFVHVVWKLKIPPRVQIFLWLLFNNKLLTRYNLAKRREVPDNTCLFCSEAESILFTTCSLIAVWQNLFRPSLLKISI